MKYDSKRIHYPTIHRHSQHSHPRVDGYFFRLSRAPPFSYPNVSDSIADLGVSTRTIIIHGCRARNVVGSNRFQTVNRPRTERAVPGRVMGERVWVTVVRTPVSVGRKRMIRDSHGGIKFAMSVLGGNSSVASRPHR